MKHTTIDITEMSDKELESFILIIRTGIIEAVIRDSKKVIKDVFSKRQIIPIDSVYTIDYAVNYTGEQIAGIVRALKVLSSIE